MTRTVAAADDIDPADVLELGLAQIAGLVRRDPSLAHRLAELCRDRIEQLNPGLNAVVDLSATDPVTGLPAGTRPEALTHGTLAGVPYLLKDLQADAAGLPLTRGSRLLVGTPSPGDSTLVTRLRAAGAMILGRTNTPEFGLHLVTEPVLHGPARNPWRLDRSPGGSSGGAAAAVAAGLVPAAHATDSAGSTRIPAAWCGLVGFKPSRGLNPAGPHRLTDWNGLSHEHAITRTVADSRHLLEVTAGPATGEWLPHPHIQPPANGPLRVGLLTATPDGSPVTDDYRTAAHAVADELAQLGHSLIEMPPLAEAARIGPPLGVVVAAHLAALVEQTAVGEPALPDLLEPVSLEMVERGRALRSTELIQAQQSLHELGFLLATRCAGVDVVLSPTTALPAPSIAELPAVSAAALFGQIFRISPFAAVLNVTGGPALSLPWGLDREQMPIGIQLGGPPQTDATILSVAQQLEHARPDLTRIKPPAVPRGAVDADR